MAADVPVTTDAELATALNTAPDGDVVVVNADFALGAAATVANSITLDLNGHAISVAGLTVAAGKAFTIRDTAGGGALSATAGFAAGITTHGATLTIESGTITATAGHGAGIGGGDGQDCGTINITGGTVTATGNSDGPGIGSGWASNGPCTISISGGQVTAVGGNLSSGIGSGWYAPAPATVSITGGTVVATGSANSAAIGGSEGSNGGTVTIGDDATVTVNSTNGRAFGGGVGGGFGTVTIGGTVIVPASASMIVPAGGAVTVTPTGSITGDGALGGAGTLANSGTLTVASIDSVENGGTLAVAGNNYVVTFDSNHVDAAPASTAQRVYAASLDAALLALPAPTLTGRTLTGWNTLADGTGTAFTSTTSISGDLTVFAVWNNPTPPVTPAPPAGGGAAVPAADSGTGRTLPPTGVDASLGWLALALLGLGAAAGVVSRRRARTQG
ncbi:InlB B-repeat-containing protein [Ruicaihuangia caeni]|uniref:InlB B-repeat-containing protein n=1 Tax=Ruicaihuangia caeni TaxID=3042517 RepID=UPI00338F609B